jgi:peptidoglycan/xylan/chitin deacetylase (PgdA/CDA1 family)
VPEPLPFKEHGQSKDDAGSPDRLEASQSGKSVPVSSHIHALSINFLTALAKPVLPAGYWATNARAGDHGKTLNLTYDDGPNPATTRQLLELLDQEGIKATFFFIGNNIQKHPELVEQVFKGGHTVGNHSLSHPFMPALSRAKMALEIDQTNRLIEEIIGEKPTLFRPPYGLIDIRGAKLLEERRMSAVYWGAVTQDWRNIGHDAVVDHIIRRLPTARLIVMHEGHDIADQCLKATATIVKRVKHLGYEFAAIK